MSKIVSRIKRGFGRHSKALGAAAACCAAVVTTATSSMAAITVDYAALGTAVEGEISSALTAWLPVAGVVLGIGLAWTIGRRFLRG